MYTTLTAVSASLIGQSLLILVQGMAGIFLFMALFYLIIWGLEELFTKRQVK